MYKIKELREINNLTQQELANKLLRKKASICDWEKSRCEPSTQDLIKLADIFNCSIDYLVGRENDFGIIEQSNNALTENEEQIIMLYRKLNEHDKYKLLGFAQALAY